MISAVPLSVFYSFQFCLTFFFSSVQSFSPFVSFQILNLHSYVSILSRLGD
ncbi:hypothetical protein V6Z11_D02G152200 [Gossypium hirsutum]